MHLFCSSASDWLQRSDDHVVALHCLAGKGRAGMMACCLLLHTGEFATAKEAIEHYDRQRMRKASKRGLTVPSQIRYVNYYERLLELEKAGQQDPAVQGEIRSLRLSNIILWKIVLLASECSYIVNRVSSVTRSVFSSQRLLRGRQGCWACRSREIRSCAW